MFFDVGCYIVVNLTQFQYAVNAGHKIYNN